MMYQQYKPTCIEQLFSNFENNKSALATPIRVQTKNNSDQSRDWFYREKPGRNDFNSREDYVNWTSQMNRDEYLKKQRDFERFIKENKGCAFHQNVEERICLCDLEEKLNFNKPNIICNAKNPLICQCQQLQKWNYVRRYIKRLCHQACMETINSHLSGEGSPEYKQKEKSVQETESDSNSVIDELNLFEFLECPCSLEEQEIFCDSAIINCTCGDSIQKSQQEHKNKIFIENLAQTDSNLLQRICPSIEARLNEKTSKSSLHCCGVNTCLCAQCQNKVRQNLFMQENLSPVKMKETGTQTDKTKLKATEVVTDLYCCFPSKDKQVLTNINAQNPMEIFPRQAQKKFVNTYAQTDCIGESPSVTSEFCNYEKCHCCDLLSKSDDDTRSGCSVFRKLFLRICKKQ